MNMGKRTKIVATIGPASEDPQSIYALIKAGLDVARLNFSHGDHNEHMRRIATIRSLSNRLEKPISILQDLQGPKLRVGDLPKEGLLLEAGQKVYIASVENTKTTELPADVVHFIPLEVPELHNQVKPGDHIMLNDGYQELEVVEIGEDYIEARVVQGGKLTSHKGVNFPGVSLNIPAFTEKDREDLLFGLSVGVDLVAMSFVKSAQDIELVRAAMRENFPEKANTPIIAKLERPEAIENLHEILQVADGVMVARGDLAVETSPAIVPIMQKKIITEANEHNRLVITATQMLESMIENPRPTRAEASDVANAIFDGTDAVMLSGETAMGKFPVRSVEMMASIIETAEKNFNQWGQIPPWFNEPTDSDAIATTRAANELARDRNVACIAVFTQTGHTAMLMSKARPRVPIIAFTPEIETYQRMGAYWGVTPFLVPYSYTVETMVTQVDAILISNHLINPGDQTVIVTGLPVGAMRQPNLALLHTVGEPV
jgi:pyruvate kinase